MEGGHFGLGEGGWLHSHPVNNRHNPPTLPFISSPLHCPVPPRWAPTPPSASLASRSRCIDAACADDDADVNCIPTLSGAGRATTLHCYCYPSVDTSSHPPYDNCNFSAHNAIHMLRVRRADKYTETPSTTTRSGEVCVETVA